MPTYGYKCSKDHYFEAVQPMSEDALDTCEICGGAASRVLFAPAVHFKGSGFYTTDYAKKGAKGANGSDGEGSKSDSKESKSESNSGSSKDSSAGGESSSGSSSSGSDSSGSSSSSKSKSESKAAGKSKD